MKMNFIVIGFIVIFEIKVISSERDINEAISICSSTTTLELDAKGVGSSLTLTLTPPQNTYFVRTMCRLHITAPDTHFIYVRLVDTDQEKEMIFQQHQENLLHEREFEGGEKVQAGRRVHSKRNGGSNNDCPVNVYQSESLNIETGDMNQGDLWTADACGASVPAEGTLFGNDVHITWMSPSSSQTKASREKSEKLKNRKLVITALGKGDTCHAKEQHVCIQVGWRPLLCIAQELLCDGVIHCPRGGILGDEDPQFCKDRNTLTSSNWERLATEFLKKFAGKTKPTSFIPAIQKDSNKWPDNWQSTETPILNYENQGSSNKNTSSPDGLSTALSQYGPWGYLMLGMLICGTILTFCGLWECCCKRSKPLHQQLDSTPTASTVAGSGMHSAVLVLGSDSHMDGAAPPSYEDLDQPPSYSALFPDQKEAEAAGQERREYTLDMSNEEMNS